MHLINKLTEIAAKQPILFTTPGHSQGRIIFPQLKNLIGKKVFKNDYSEIIGLDNLQSPSDTLLKSQLRAGVMYNSKASFYLTNGSSSGITALMLATAKKGDKILISRNAHKSVINALILTGAIPVWLDADWINDWNISNNICTAKIEETLNKNPDITSVWITNPTYEGITVEVAEISRICKEKNVMLIVDEAHGALWNFHNSLPEPAIKLGADASVQSLHKSASCLTQGAILHIAKSASITPEKMQECLNVTNTTSPSYVLLASIEGAIEHINSIQGEKDLSNLLENISIFKEKLTKYPEIMFYNNENHDPTKLLFKLKDISGNLVAEHLENKRNIEVELNNDVSLMAYTGIGTTKKKLDKLMSSLILSVKTLPKRSSEPELNNYFSSPHVIFSPADAFNKKSKILPIQECQGLVAKETIVPYPPGIPILISGELIMQNHIEYLIKAGKKSIEIIID